MQLTKNFDLSEFLTSSRFPELIKDIHIADSYKWNLFKLCAIHLQNIRDFLKVPLCVTSGYRTPALNRALKGSNLSQHMFGEAADFVVSGQLAMEDALAFIKHDLWPAVGDCIDYRDNSGNMLWIHISLPSPSCIQRFSTIHK